MLIRNWFEVMRAKLSPAPTRRKRRALARSPRPEILEVRRVLTFNVAVDYAVGLNPQAIVSGDFNRDQIVDLATADAASNTVSVLLGNGDGTFQSALTSTTGNSPLSLSVGDFDEDGNLDLATANAYDVSVLLGDGAGTFNAPASYAVVGNPTSVAVGDFNDDGHLDLGVTSNSPYYRYFPGYGNYFYGYAGNANVLLGNGDGTFSGPNVTELGLGYHYSAAVADLNGDGVDDFATVNYDYWTASVLLGDASGFLQGPTSYGVGPNPYAVTAGNLNNDGHVDLVVTNLGGSSVNVLLGNEFGSFASASYAVGNGPLSVAIGDFNGDLEADIATVNRYDNTLSVLYGVGDGTFSRPVNLPGTGAYALVVEDFNGDGRPDLATVNDFSNNVSVLINDGNWPPAPPPPARLSIDDISVVEGDNGIRTVTFTVTRTGNLSGTVTVNYNTADIEALAGSDYIAKTGTLTFADGVETQMITIDVKGDLNDEYDQRFAVNLFSASGETLIIDGQGQATIQDNDPPPTITITAKVSKPEGNGKGTTVFSFVVTLSAASEKLVTVDFFTSNGTASIADNDYVGNSGTLFFNPGQTTQTISVAVKGDKRREGNETFFVNLTGATNATIATAQGIGEILEDDAPPVKGRK